MIGMFVLQGLTQILLGLAQSIGGDMARQQFALLLTQKRLRSKIDAAAERAYQKHFPREVHDAELVTLLKQQHFEDNPVLGMVLARIAAEPRQCVELTHELADLIATTVPTIAPQRCLAAAQVLTHIFQSEVGKIPELYQALLVLHLEKISLGIGGLRPVPDFAPGLRETITASARQVALELKQMSVSLGHLLYGLAVLPQGISPQILATCQATPTAIRVQLAHAIDTYDGPVSDPMTENAVNALNRAREIARDTAAPVTRDDHLLIALMELSAASISFQWVLTGLHLDPDRLRDLVYRQGRVITAMNSLSNLAHEEQ